MTDLVNEFIEALQRKVPQVETQVEAGHSGAVTWIDVRAGEQMVTVEYRPNLGFGLHRDDEDQGFGERPDEIYRAVTPLVTRVTELLEPTEGHDLGLRQLRELRGLTQEEMAALLGKRQSAVSKLESREELLVGSLQNFVRALGGTLHVVAKFKDFDVPLGGPFLADRDADSSEAQWSRLDLLVLDSTTRWVRLYAQRFTSSVYEGGYCAFFATVEGGSPKLPHAAAGRNALRELMPSEWTPFLLSSNKTSRQSTDRHSLESWLDPEGDPPDVRFGYWRVQQARRFALFRSYPESFAPERIQGASRSLDVGLHISLVADFLLWVIRTTSTAHDQPFELFFECKWSGLDRRFNQSLPSSRERQPMNVPRELTSRARVASLRISDQLESALRKLTTELLESLGVELPANVYQDALKKISQDR